MNLSKPLITSIVIGAATLLVIGTVESSIARKQAILEEGSTVFLRLAPVDPRSLMQGDYMILQHQLSREMQRARGAGDVSTRGRAILKVNEDGVARFSRFDDVTAVADDELTIRYRRSRRGFTFGLESYFFEEGNAPAFESAEFSEVKLGEDGRVVLVGLTDGERERIWPE